MASTKVSSSAAYGHRAFAAIIGSVGLVGDQFPLGKPKVALRRDEFLPFARGALDGRRVVVGASELALVGQASDPELSLLQSLGQAGLAVRPPMGLLRLRPMNVGRIPDRAPIGRKTSLDWQEDQKHHGREDIQCVDALHVAPGSGVTRICPRRTSAPSYGMLRHPKDVCVQIANSPEAPLWRDVDLGESTYIGVIRTSSGPIGAPEVDLMAAPAA